MQVFVFAKFGGISGFIDAFSGTVDAFEGMGWIFLIAEAFPYFLFILILTRKRQVLKRMSWWSLSIVGFLFFVIKLIFGGLHGSRSNTVWAMVWLAGAVHLWIKPLPRKFVVLGLAGLIMFMYLYGFYKAQGLDAINTIQTAEERQTAGEKTGRTLDTTLLGDLARSEIQSYLLYRIVVIRDYDYALGSTYVSAASLIVPKSIRPEWIPSKIEKGTEALHGKGTYSREYRRALEVYGLAGEAMLNFTPLAVPFAFLALAYTVAKARALLLLHPNDIRRLLLPFFSIGCVLVINSDLDNIIVFSVATLLPVYLFLRASSVSASMYSPVTA
jgi:hypothetical protein